MNLSQRSIYAALALAVLLYLAQSFTPLRLTSDGIAYLSLADIAAHSGVANALRQSGFPFPKGYPLFVSVLMRAGVFSSATLVLSNLIFFGAGLFFSFRTLLAIGFERRETLVACLLTLLSFAAVKFITQGMSDFLFFSLAAAACRLITVQHPAKWIALLPCVACAIEVRFIGLAFLAPIFVLAWPFLRKRPIALALGAVVSAICVVAGALAGHHYLHANLKILHNNSLWRFAGKNALAHLQDFGELIMNAPLSKLPPWTYVASLMIGAVALSIFILGIVSMWHRCRWVAVYLIAYSGLILPWPYTDPRFWMPAMPFVLLAMYLGLKRAWRSLPRPVVPVYAVLFSAIGFAALGYSSRLTFAGSQFPYRYGDGRLTATYLAHCANDTADTDQPALQLLQRYQWHCPNTQ